jgi:16S rRNA C967 or C1407 C5-methylase (RsmB/RsmF family)
MVDSCAEKMIGFRQVKKGGYELNFVVFILSCSAGIQSCRPGGTIVYSTCTLAATQNDGVVMATLERIWQQTDIEVVVENLSDVITRFSSTFTFLPSGLPGSRYGCLVLPKLTANFGPMYICRMRRIN